MKANETAVVFIEFQNEFCKDGGKFYDGVKSEIERIGTVPNAQKLLEACREKGVTIVHSPFIFDEEWVDQCGCAGILAGAKEGGACRPGDWGTEIIDEMAPKDGEIVLAGKHALSGFTNTKLEDVLKEKGIKNVVCAGFLSNVCVESTARSAYDLGYQVRVVHDATGGLSKANQDYVENEIYPVLGGSMTVDEFIAQLD